MNTIDLQTYSISLDSLYLQMRTLHRYDVHPTIVLITTPCNFSYTSCAAVNIDHTPKAEAVPGAREHAGVGLVNSITRAALVSVIRHTPPVNIDL